MQSTRGERGADSDRRPAGGRGEGRGRGGFQSGSTEVGGRGTGSVGQRAAAYPAGLGALGPVAVAAASGTAGSSAQGSAATRGFSSANHLLNFSYESGRGAGRAQKYDRNKFLQANFRFLVSDAVDVASYAADADKMFDWEDVVQVQMMSAEPVVCPISLDSPPLCPAITPCGHIFSFPAIMQHLLNFGGDTLRRSGPCPLCFAPLVARELRLASVLIVKPPTAGDAVTFSRLTRPRGSVLPAPATAAPPTAIDAAPAAATASAGATAPADLSDSAPAATASAAAAPPSVWDPVKPAGSNGDGGGAVEGGGGGGGGGKKGAGKGGRSAAAVAVAAAVADGDAFRANRFSKFVVSERGQPLALWKAAARELAVYAAEVTACGGLEAALEAPSIYAALDALAARARKWTHHRVEGFASRGVALPEAAAAIAAAAATVAAAGEVTGGGLSAHAAAAMAAAARGSEAGAGVEDVAALLAAAAEAEIKKEFTAVTTKAASSGSPALALPQVPKAEFPALPPPSLPCTSSTTATLRSAPPSNATSHTTTPSAAAAPAAATSTQPIPVPGRHRPTPVADIGIVSGDAVRFEGHGQSAGRSHAAESHDAAAAAQQPAGGEWSEEWEEGGGSQDCGLFHGEEDWGGGGAVGERARGGLRRGGQEAADLGNRRRARPVADAAAPPRNGKGAGSGGGGGVSGLSVSAAVFAPARTGAGAAAAAAAVPAGTTAAPAGSTARVAGGGEGSPSLRAGDAGHSEGGAGGRGGDATGAGGGEGPGVLSNGDAVGQGRSTAGSAANGKNRSRGPGGSAAAASASGGAGGTAAAAAAAAAQEEFCTYQLADGQWVFLHPLSLRCLLQHYQTPDACPAQLSGTILELEDVVQNDASRKRWKFLAHLPLTATFRLAEIQMSALLPADALAPFAEEITAREKRRHRKVLESRRATANEATAAAAAREARLGPSLAELRLMPILSNANNGGGGGGGAAATAAAGAAGGAASSCHQEGAGEGSGGEGGESRRAALLRVARETGMSAAELEESMALQASLDASAPPSAPSSSAPGTSPPAAGGVSFAHMTKLGYAATGPALGSSPGASVAQASALGVWAGKGGGPSSSGKPSVPTPVAPQLTPLSWVLSPTPPSAPATAATAAAAAAAAAASAGGDAAPAPAAAGGSRKGSKKGALLFTTTQRKY
ncbi:MAG: hypothetical protein WDW36_005071 [Sanguina aurantia]